MSNPLLLAPQIGVGSSRLQEDMAKAGWAHIVNVDYSKVAIAHMAELHRGYPQLQYSVADARWAEEGVVKMQVVACIDAALQSKGGKNCRLAIGCCTGGERHKGESQAGPKPVPCTDRRLVGGSRDTASPGGSMRGARVARKLETGGTVTKGGP